MTAPKHRVTVTTHGPHYYLDCTTGRYVHA